MKILKWQSEVEEKYWNEEHQGFDDMQELANLHELSDVSRIRMWANIIRLISNTPPLPVAQPHKL